MGALFLFEMKPGIPWKVLGIDVPGKGFPGYNSPAFPGIRHRYAARAAVAVAHITVE